MNVKTKMVSPLVMAGMALALMPGILMLLILWFLPAPEATDRIAKAMRGFTNMWFAGRAALENPALLIDPQAYTAGLREMFSVDIARHVWGYPPSMLSIVAPFGALPLELAFALWTSLGLLVFFLSMHLRKGLGFPTGVLIAVMFSPALLENALSGQTGALAGGFLVAGLLGAATRPMSSGLMLGALSVKPQMGLLIPIHLLASRRYRTLMWGAVSCLGLIGLSMLIWGLEPWFYFFGSTSGKMTGIMQQPFQGLPTQINFTSPFMATKALGGDSFMAWTVQGLIAVLCILACVTTSSRLRHVRGEDRLLCVSFVIGLDLLAVPYSHNYDMPALAVATALLYRYSLMHGVMFRGERLLLAVAWVWPGIMVFLPIFFPSMAMLSPILGATSLLTVAILGWMRCRRIPVILEVVADGRLGYNGTKTVTGSAPS